MDRGDRIAELMETMEAFSQWQQKLQRKRILPGLTLRDAALIHAVMQQPGMFAGTLAERLRTSPATITQTLVRLRKAGYIHVEKDPDDGRYRRVSPTPASRAQYNDMMSVVAQHTESLFVGWTEGHVEAFSSLLEQCMSTETPGFASTVSRVLEAETAPLAATEEARVPLQPVQWA